MDFLLIDGYNLINAWNDVFQLDIESLEDCRARLYNILSNYQGFRKLNIIVVFDAHLVKGSREKEETFDNLKIVFTKENETADNYIEKFVHKLGNTHRITVVTSDYLEQTMVLSNGGIRMVPGELKSEIENARRNIKNGSRTGAKATNPIMSNLKPELAEKLEEMRRGKF